MPLASLPSLGDPTAKLRRIRRMVPPIAAVLHIAQAVIFFAMGHPLHAWVSVAAVAVFAVAAGLQRAGWWKASLALVWVEVVAHSSWLTLSFGAATLYPLYWMALSAGAFLVYARDDAERLPAALVPAVGGPLLYALAPAPWFGPLDPEVVTALAFMNLAGLGTALVGVVMSAVWATDAAEEALRAERDRSRALLHNVLPVAIADRLETEPGLIVDHVDGVAVLFADLVGFTTLAASEPPERLIALLNEVFSRFDAHADRLGIEKIKTIGDAYMAVAGLPAPHDSPAVAAVEMARAMRQEVEAVAEQTGARLQIRVGIHYGPVVAGVIGTRKFAYDLWGDAVNVASRMESHGEPGRIQVTEAVVAAAPDVAFEARGTVDVKGRGPMPTWWVA